MLPSKSSKLNRLREDTLSRYKQVVNYRLPPNRYKYKDFSFFILPDGRTFMDMEASDFDNILGVLEAEQLTKEEREAILLIAGTRFASAQQKKLYKYILLYYDINKNKKEINLHTLRFKKRLISKVSNDV